MCVQKARFTAHLIMLFPFGLHEVCCLLYSPFVKSWHFNLLRVYKNVHFHLKLTKKDSQIFIDPSGPALPSVPAATAVQYASELVDRMFFHDIDLF